MITLQGLRDYVHADLDMDDDDLPYILVDQWVKNRFTEIVRYHDDWTFYRVETTIETESGTDTYDLESDNIKRISEVIGAPGSHIGQLYNRSAVGAQKAAYPLGVTELSRRPDWFEWDKNNQLLTLYPTPDGSYELTVRGYREASYGSVGHPTWEADLPDQFEPVLLAGVMSDAYEWDDDPRSQMQMAKFQNLLVQMASDDQKAPPLEGPLVMGGSRRKNGLGRPLAPGYDYMTVG